MSAPLQPQYRPCPHFVVSNVGLLPGDQPTKRFCEHEKDHAGRCFGNKSERQYEAELKAHRAWKKTKRKSRR